SSRKVLHTVAAFRMPATYDTLAALLVGSGKTFGGEQQLDAALTALEDRGLLGWDRIANRYDLHPVVRGVAWERLDGLAKEGIYNDWRAHSEAVPADGGWDHVTRVEEMTASLELYNTLVGLGRPTEALDLMRERLYPRLFFRLGAMHQLAELLEMLFPDGTDG